MHEKMLQNSAVNSVFSWKTRQEVTFLHPAFWMGEGRDGGFYLEIHRDDVPLD